MEALILLLGYLVALILYLLIYIDYKVHKEYYSQVTEEIEFMTEQITRRNIMLEKSQPALITLQRTGLNPICFQGEVLVEHSGASKEEVRFDRYHNVTIYKSTQQSYVVFIEYVTKAPREFGQKTAIVCNNEKQVIRALTDYDPIAYLIGYPLGERFAEKQARLEKEIINRYEAQVTEVLNSERFTQGINQ